MRIYIVCILVLLFYTGCANKIYTQTDIDTEITIEKIKAKNIIYLDIQNSTNENIELRKYIEKELLEKDYALSNELYEVDYHIFIDIVYADKITQKSSTKKVLSNVNIGLGIGGTLNRGLGIGATIGSSIGKIIGDSMDTKMYQIVCDITVDEYSKNQELVKESHSQIVVETTTENRNKYSIIRNLSKEISKIIANIF